MSAVQFGAEYRWHPGPTCHGPTWPDMAHMNFNRQRVGLGINAICPWPTASWFNNMYLLNFWGKIFQVKMKRDKVWNGQDRNTNIPILQCTRPSLIPVLSDDYSIELIDPINCPNWHFCCFTPSLSLHLPLTSPCLIKRWQLPSVFLQPNRLGPTHQLRQKPIVQSQHVPILQESTSYRFLDSMFIG